MREFTHPFEAIEAAPEGAAVRLLTDSGPLIISPPVITSGDPLVAEVLAVPPPGGLAMKLGADAVAFLDIVRTDAADAARGFYAYSVVPHYGLAMTSEALKGAIAQLPACIDCMDSGERWAITGMDPEERRIYLGPGLGQNLAWCHCPAGDEARAGVRPDHAEYPGGRRC